MRRFLSKKAYWISGALVLLVFFLVLLLRPTQGVKFPDGSVLTVVYSRYDKWHPVVYGKVGYAICQILPQKAVLPLNNFCHRFFRSGGFLAGFGPSSTTADLWQVELLLSRIDPKRDHPLLAGVSLPLSGPVPSTLRADVVGNDGRRYKTGAIEVYPAPHRRLIFTLLLDADPMELDDKVTIQIWQDGETNAVCSLPVRNPISVLVPKGN